MGQQSTLHAIKTPKRLNRNNIANNTIRESISESDLDDGAGSKPMNETLADLTLGDSNKQESNEVLFMCTANVCKFLSVIKVVF